MKRQTLAAALLFLALTASHGTTPAKHKTIYDYSLVALDGKEVSLSTYKGKALLIVNLASQSIYREQLAALQDLQKTYADKGLVILGIPSGDFGEQEPGDADAIKHYYLDAQHITFPIYAKSTLRGKDTIPLAKFLTDPKDGVAGGEVHWNFTKFLVNREGQPVARFEAGTDPADPDFRVVVEKVLDGSFKKQGGPGKEGNGPPAGGDDDDDGV